jgi:hypothetical protein
MNSIIFTFGMLFALLFLVDSSFGVPERSRLRMTELSSSEQKVNTETRMLQTKNLQDTKDAVDAHEARGLKKGEKMGMMMGCDTDRRRLKMGGMDDGKMGMMMGDKCTPAPTIAPTTARPSPSPTAA